MNKHKQLFAVNNHKYHMNNRYEINRAFTELVFVILSQAISNSFYQRTKMDGIDDGRKLISLSDLHAKFGWEEYVVLAVTLSISGIIGIFWAWKSRKVYKSRLFQFQTK